MNKYHVAAIGLALVWRTSPVLSVEGQVWVSGPQPSSCGSFLQAGGEHDQAWRLWILGFWSGMNWEAANRQKGTTGSSTDRDGIVLSVKKHCQDDPALSVPFVISKLHEQFERDSR
jgi:hypothetical protein